MSVPLRCSSEKELSSSSKSRWISEEESLTKSVENFLTTRAESRRRSCSPNIIVTSDDKTSSTLTSADKPKKQVGMDKYITVLKRQRSPTSAQTSSASKAPKTVSSTVPRDQNRFALLQTDEAVIPKKLFKPPPIYLREPTSSKLVQGIVAAIGENMFSVTSVKHGKISETKIQVKKEDDFRKLSNLLERENRDFYTYQLKSAKGLQVVLKGIDPCVDPMEIKTGLTEKGFKIKNVVNIINRDKIPQPMFRVELEPGDVVLKKNETHPIYNLMYLLHRRITVEEPHKRLGPVQCLNCQEYGHTKAYCKLPSVCVACGELHSSVQCNKSKTDSKTKKCSNCGGNHTANYRGCPVYTHLKRLRTTKSSILPIHPQQPNFTTSNNFPQLERPVNHENAPNTKQVSYANVVKLNMPGLERESGSQYSEPLLNNLQSTLQTLVQTMNTFTVTMTTMMQEMLKMQSTILQAIVNK